MLLPRREVTLLRVTLKLLTGLNSCIISGVKGSFKLLLDTKVKNTQGDKS